MKPIIHSSRMRQRAALSNVASVGGLLILLLSVVIPLFWPAWVRLAPWMMGAGLAISMVGIYFANRWVKKPRPEDRLDAALKSLSDAHRLYHYARLPADHVLLTPGGVLVIETVNLEGLFTYKDGRWREQISLGRALRYIVEEHLGDPIKAVQSSAQALKLRLENCLGEELKVPVRSVVVFTHPRARLEIGSTPVPVVVAEKLKKLATEKGAKLLAEVYEQVRAILDESSEA